MFVYVFVLFNCLIVFWLLLCLFFVCFLFVSFVCLFVCLFVSFDDFL